MSQPDPDPTASYTGRFADEAHDLPQRPLGVLPDASLVLLSTPRSGSNLLGDALRLSGGLGVPMEYLDLGAAMPTLSARWGSDGLAGYLADLHRHRTDPSGWFALKVHWPQLLLFHRAALGRDVAPGDEGVLRELVEQLFPGTRWVHLRRRDAVAQAVSWWRASVTGRYARFDDDDGERAPQPEVGPVELAEIADLAEQLHTWDAGSRAFLRDVDALELTFEEVRTDPADAVRRVRAHLGLDEGVEGPPTTRRQSGPWSREVHARVLASLPAARRRRLSPGSQVRLAVVEAAPDVRDEVATAVTAAPAPDAPAAAAALLEVQRRAGGLQVAAAAVGVLPPEEAGAALAGLARLGRLGPAALAVALTTAPDAIEVVGRAVAEVSPSLLEEAFERLVAEESAHAPAVARLLLSTTGTDVDAPTPGERLGFVVVGTGRCGTGFTAEALQGRGVDAGHEERFTVDPSRRRDDLDGDVSWLAVPYLDRLDVPVVHQVRHPVDTVRSLVGIEMFSSPVHGAYRWFMHAHLDGLSTLDVASAVRWYVRWNARIEERTDRRHRAEDLRGPGFGALVDDLAVDRAAAAPPPSGRVNARPRAEGLTTAEILAAPDGDELVEMAARYGYELG